jgi:hypothetical protein
VKISRKTKFKSSFGAFLVFFGILVFAYSVELENWRKVKFDIYLETTYPRLYLALHHRLPTSLDDFEATLAQSGAETQHGPHATMLETYHLYHPKLTNVKASADGKRVESVIKFDGHWVKQLKVVMEDRS